jgi:putative endonuclease
MSTVYVLYSRSLDRNYIGYSDDFDKRLSFHLNPIESRKFTSKADDWEVFITIECISKSQGIKIEKHIKSMKSKTYINNLKRYPEMVDKLLARFN